MTKPTQSSAPAESQDNLVEAVSGLLREPFAVQNRLGYADLQKAGESLEGDGASLSAKLRESFERCKAAYCQILLELEARGMAESSVTRLADLAKKPAAAPPAKPTIVTSPAPVAKPAVAASPASDDAPTVPKAPIAPKKNPALPPTNEYVRIAQYFRSLIETGNSPFPAEHTRRLMGQNYCFALEDRLREVFEPALPGFWAEREAATEKLFADGEFFTFQPALHEELDQAAAARVEWLGEEKFPVGAATMALRYIFARPTADDFAPSLNEAATVILFFANPGPLGEWALGNELRVTGITQPEAVELAFNLYRLHRLRIELLSPHRVPNSHDLDTLSRTVQRLFALLAKMRFATPSNKAAA